SVSPVFTGSSGAVSAVRAPSRSAAPVSPSAEAASSAFTATASSALRSTASASRSMVTGSRLAFEWRVLGVLTIRQLLSSRCCAAQHTYHSRAARKKLALTGKKRKQRFFVRFLRNVQTVPCLRRQHFPNSFRNSEIGRLREQAACRDSRERLRREGGIEQHAIDRRFQLRHFLFLARAKGDGAIGLDNEGFDARLPQPVLQYGTAHPPAEDKHFPALRQICRDAPHEPFRILALGVNNVETSRAGYLA